MFYRQFNIRIIAEWLLRWGLFFKESMEVEERLKHTSYVIFDAIIRSWQNFSATLTDMKRLQTLIWLLVSFLISTYETPQLSEFSTHQTLHAHFLDINIIRIYYKTLL